MILRMLSVPLLRCRPYLRPPSTMSSMMVLHRQLCRLTWSKHANFRHLIDPRIVSCRQTRLLTLLRTYLLFFFCYQQEMWSCFLKDLFLNVWNLFLVSAGSVQVSCPSRRMDTTSDLWSLILIWKQMLPFYILSILSIASVTVAICHPISALNVPSCNCI